MIIIEKKIEIRCQSDNSREEISQLVTQAFTSWQRRINAITRTEFVDELAMIPTITFILGTITTGFLKEIGEEIWNNLKEVVSKGSNCNQKPNMKFDFNYEGIDILVEVEHNDLETLHSVLKNMDDIITGISKEEEQVKFILGENGKFKRKF
ncbi:MAG: hypothetical protein ACQEP9_06825 [Bacillota bacterium]